MAVFLVPGTFSHRLKRLTRLPSRDEMKRGEVLGHPRSLRSLREPQERAEGTCLQPAVWAGPGPPLSAVPQVCQPLSPSEGSGWSIWRLNMQEFLEHWGSHSGSKLKSS